VREVLHRDLYRGVITWNKSRKRNQWGAQQQAARPAGDWLELPAPALRIVSEDLWAAARARLDAARAIYFHATAGQAFGRPALATPAKYLLTGPSQCGECGSGLIVKSRSHGRRRAYFYACGGYHNRGTAVCSNYTEIPMAAGNDIIIEALLDDVLDETMLTRRSTMPSNCCRATRARIDWRRSSASSRRSTRNEPDSWPRLFQEGS
jgi:recombinase-like zinc beta ribbon protein/recombinase